MRIGEWSKLAVDVSDSGAGCIDHLTSALPNLERQLVLLSTPDQETRIISPKLPEKPCTNGKESSRHDGTPKIEIKM